MTSSILAGRYQLVRKLGQGGMGSVWEAIHLGLNTRVAIKLIDPSITLNLETLGRFRREAQAAASLRCPNVVQILDYGVDEGRPYIAMELLEGEDLEARLKRIGKLSAQSTAVFLSQAARALDRAHQMGIVHRDLKPENLFIVRDGDQELVKVLDFGVAKRQSEIYGDSGPATRSGALLGTPYYMSPEQATARRAVDHRTDIWAIAVVAFKCLTGRLPFDGGNLGGLVLSICTDTAPVPSRIATVPAGFDEWFARGVEKHPDHRFQSAIEAARELSRIAGILERSTPPGPEDHGGDRAAPPQLLQPTGEAMSVDPFGSTASQMPPSTATLPRGRKRSKALLISGWGLGALVVVGVAGTLLAGGEKPVVSLAASVQPAGPSSTFAGSSGASAPVMAEVAPSPSYSQGRQQEQRTAELLTLGPRQRAGSAAHQAAPSAEPAVPPAPTSEPSAPGAASTFAASVPTKSRLDTEPGF